MLNVECSMLNPGLNRGEARRYPRPIGLGEGLGVRAWRVSCRFPTRTVKQEAAEIKEPVCECSMLSVEC